MPITYEKLKKYSELRWPNYTWYVIHTICLYAYLKSKEFEEQIDEYKEFFRDLQQELPCPECMEHCGAHLRNNPFTKKTNMHKWATEFHNSVNERLGKNRFSTSEAKKFYMERNGSEYDLVIDWTFYYYMVKIYANVAYTNRTIEHFCEFMESLRKILPDKDIRRDLPKLKDATEKNVYIRKYLAILKRNIPSKSPKITFGQQ